MPSPAARAAVRRPVHRAPSRLRSPRAVRRRPGTGSGRSRRRARRRGRRPPAPRAARRRSREPAPQQAAAARPAAARRSRVARARPGTGGGAGVAESGATWSALATGGGSVCVTAGRNCTLGSAETVGVVGGCGVADHVDRRGGLNGRGRVDDGRRRRRHGLRRAVAGVVTSTAGGGAVVVASATGGAPSTGAVRIDGRRRRRYRRLAVLCELRERLRGVRVDRAGGLGVVDEHGEARALERGSHQHAGEARTRLADLERLERAPAAELGGDLGQALRPRTPSRDRRGTPTGRSGSESSRSSSAAARSACSGVLTSDSRSGPSAAARTVSAAGTNATAASAPTSAHTSARLPDRATSLSV